MAAIELIAFVQGQTEHARSILSAGRDLPAKYVEQVLAHISKYPESWDFDAVPTILPECCINCYGPTDLTYGRVDDLLDRSFKQITTAAPLYAITIQALLKAGLAVAGEVVFSLFNDCLIEADDIDVFAPGIVPDEAEARFMKAIDRDARRRAVYRTNGCITVCCTYRGSTRSVTVRLITRKYDNVNQVIYGFDIAPCALALMGGRLYYTFAASVAYRSGVFFPDVSKRRYSFEQRIEKYYNRGFAVAFPNACSLEGLKHHASLKIETMVGKQSIKSMRRASSTSDYGGPSALAYNNAESISNLNIENLLRGRQFLVWRMDGTLFLTHDDLREGRTGRQPNSTLVAFFCGVSKVPKLCRRIHLAEIALGRSLPGLLHMAAMACSGIGKKAAQFTRQILDDFHELETVLASRYKHCPQHGWRDLHDGTDLYKAAPLSAIRWYGGIYRDMPIVDTNLLGDSMQLLQIAGDVTAVDVTTTADAALAVLAAITVVPVLKGADSSPEKTMNRQHSAR